MSQKNEKLRRQVERLNARVVSVEQRFDAWAAAESAVHNQAALDAATERNAERRRAREAERAVVAWRRMTYAVLVASIIVLVAAILVVNAEADAEVIDPPVVVTAAETFVETIEEPEEPENERIEVALLARAHVIEDCTVTFYCNEKYPHICGTGDGIAYDGTPVLAWATCAVDPDVIPLGSTVMVDLGDGDGLRTLAANDTGVKGNHLDICVGSHREALDLGVKTASVYWCEE